MSSHDDHLLRERARVVAVDGPFAWIESQRRSSCDSCAVTRGCGTGALSRFFSRRITGIKAENTLSAVVGDSVVVAIDERALVRGSIAVYLTPLLLMFLFAVTVDLLLASLLPLASRDIWVAIAGLCGLGAGLVWLRYFSQRILNERRYLPRIVERDDGVVTTAIDFK